MRERVPVSLTALAAAQPAPERAVSAPMAAHHVVPNTAAAAAATAKDTPPAAPDIGPRASSENQAHEGGPKGPLCLLPQSLTDAIVADARAIHARFEGASVPLAPHAEDAPFLGDQPQGSSVTGGETRRRRAGSSADEDSAGVLRRRRSSSQEDGGSAGHMSGSSSDTSEAGVETDTSTESEGGGGGGDKRSPQAVASRADTTAPRQRHSLAHSRTAGASVVHDLDVDSDWGSSTAIGEAQPAPVDLARGFSSARGAGAGAGGGAGAGAGSGAGAGARPSEHASHGAHDDVRHTVSMGPLFGGGATGLRPSLLASLRGLAGDGGGATAVQPVVEVTPCSYIPGARIDTYLGRINLHFIKVRSASMLWLLLLLLCVL